MMRTILGGFALLMLLMPAPAGAQRNEARARVIQEAPLVLLPDARRIPLRVAAVGTSLVVIGDEGEWLHIQFQDPQYGLRTGYVQRRFVEIQPRQVAIDPSTRSAAPQAAPVAAPSTRAEAGAPASAGAPSPTSQQPKVVTPITAARSSLGRDGFWFSAGLGYGSWGCDNCSDRVTGGSGGLSAGVTMNDRVLVGGGTTGFYRRVDGATLTAGTYDFRIRFYPARTSGFFVNGGFGLGQITVHDAFNSDTEWGVGAMVGVGWDLRVGKNVSLSPFWSGSGISTKSLNANFGQFGLGVTIH